MGTPLHPGSIRNIFEECYIWRQYYPGKNFKFIEIFFNAVKDKE